MSGAFFRALARDAARRYPARDLHARWFAYFKLTRDPVFRHLLEHGLIPSGARLLDLGCGQGMVEVLFASAAEAGARWPAGWAPPPAPRRLQGIDLRARDIERASAAVPTARFVCGDIRTAEFDAADAVIILDVLHYLPRADQDRILERARAALPPGGRLVLRVADASQGLRFHVTQLVDKLSLRLRGGRPGRYHCRPLGEWKRRLAELGFEMQTRPMSEGTPFANHLIVATAR